MMLNIPDEIIRGLGGDEQSVLIEIAVALYKLRRMTLARAARLVGTDRIGFQRILGERGLELNYTMEAAEEDIRLAHELSERLSSDRSR
ncbi:MAG: UPF0175 family protein [Planctomycetes bacterium]|nr:UPF0175 family protein [Planctomycetota bacterium]